MRVLAMTAGYLSQDKAHLAAQQRARRARMVRIDYMPSSAALDVIAAKRATTRPGSIEATNSAVLDAILVEWAKLTGIKKQEVEAPKTPKELPELMHQYARAHDFDGHAGINAHIASAHAGAYESGHAASVTCGARRHRDGKPCQAKSEPGKRRCRFHGGRSTGPRTTEGKARALENLRQYMKA
ncbi:HGGxSTG domain-containing protein [Xanthomonas hortorum]|uniref:HGGxSTG domain-containing protein n=1 Tax=Xanthomonas hortorum TaxID=56454 RepID=UPI001F468330|nr:HGGxSTG domain-containing protein [Xanthomonas hortorum]MCE4510319.1 hypothetical protein [Xanthomonas hortorum pv. vitians]MCE4520568.1 hypothetical protein [Xanthomonas hortorum pv. vitians]